MSQSRTPARAPLSREAVVAAAVGLVGENGPERLTMRKVAERLSVSPSALYVHVDGREELLRLAIDGVLGPLTLPPPDPLRWAEQVVAFARAAREALARGPAAARLPFEQVPPGPHATEVSTWLLAVLTAGGLPATAAAQAASLIVEHVGSAAGDAAVQGGAAPRPEPLAGLAVPAGPLADTTPDERFEFGLDVLVTGLTAMAARRHSSPRL